MAMKITSFLSLILLLIPLFPKLFQVEALCIEMERNALLKFKASLQDPSSSGRLSSWVGGDCCEWEGIGCSNETGNVIKLDLSNPFQPNEPEFPLSRLVGQISDSLLDLKHLNYLDLSSNDFQRNPIPNFLGSFENLNYLNLSRAGFSGMIPPHLGNLSKLHQLDISSSSSYDGSWVSDLNWLSGLSSSLKYLNMGSVNLSEAQEDWLQAVNMLPFLSEMHLSNCQLNNFPQSLPFVNFTSLSVLNLNDNQFRASMPSWLFNLSTLVELRLRTAQVKGPLPLDSWGNLCSLKVLDLWGNSISDAAGIEFVDSLATCSNRSLEELLLGQNLFSGHFPDSLRYLNNLRWIDISDNHFIGNLPSSLGNLQNLRWIDLSKNELSGVIPDSIGNLGNLRYLDVSYNSISGSIPVSIGRLLLLEELEVSHNKMNGTIPESIGQLAELHTLQMDWNPWKGTVSEIHLTGLTKLENLLSYLSPATNNPLVFDIRSDWIPPVSLKTIRIGNCMVSRTFPAWLGTQKELYHIILRNVGISDIIPEWLWKLSPQLGWLDLSRNQLRGKLPSPLYFSTSHGWCMADLSFNRLEGPLPLWYNLTYLLLGNNLLSGPIPSNIGVSASFRVLAVPGNMLNGSIPFSLSKLKFSRIIDLSNNQLSGKIPDNWSGTEMLGILDLSKNRLYGGIPTSICSMQLLYLLSLGDNNLSGELSPNLQNCTGLNSLDLGNNRLTGEIPKWIIERMPLLKQLRLRGNMLTGKIPQQLCELSDLRILDLALNNLSESIPPCLGHLSALNLMASLDTPSDDLYVDYYTERMDLVVKGKEMEFQRILSIVKLTDLSSNHLSGDIPHAIANLSTLGTLNLSRNQLAGEIPEDIGDMKGLETLDLSSNRLTGRIPTSMSSITFLSHLNLSHNFLSGPIPTTNQFQTFNDPSMFEGNPGLCGLPLSTKCSTPNKDEEEKKEEDEDEDGWKMSWFFTSMGLGFPVGFWVVCGTLALKNSWRYAFFQLVDKAKNRLYVLIALSVATLKRKLERNDGTHGE